MIAIFNKAKEIQNGDYYIRDESGYKMTFNGI